LQYVLLGPASTANNIYIGATKDLNNQPVFPTTLDNQAQLSKITYALDTTCSSLGAFAAFGARVYDWSKKIKEGERAEIDRFKLVDLDKEPAGVTDLVPSEQLAREIAAEFKRLAESKVRGEGLSSTCLSLLQLIGRANMPTPWPMPRAMQSKPLWDIS
jgi:hypothetical protein